MSENKTKEIIARTLADNYFDVDEELVDAHYVQFRKEAKERKLFYKNELDIFLTAYLDRVIIQSYPLENQPDFE